MRLTAGPPTIHVETRDGRPVQRLTLDDSFSKFNFLDTDAAVRLTVESSGERISQDLTQLLLGAEAAKALFFSFSTVSPGLKALGGLNRAFFPAARA